MIICPSILEKNIEDYFKNIEKLSSYFSYFQIDIADGQYVKNKTATIDDFIKKAPNYQSLKKDLYFDFHLMVKNYNHEIKKLESLKKILKIKNIFVHFDLVKKNSFKFDKTIGLVLNPQDKVDDLAGRIELNLISSIQIMSVIPGAQGNPFIKNSLNKIEQLRTLGYRNKIFLDGGINEKTLPVILKEKFLPDVLCPGSYFTKTKNEKETEKKFNQFYLLLKKFI